MKAIWRLGVRKLLKVRSRQGLASILPKLTVARELEQGYLRKVDISGINITRNLWLVQKNKRFNKLGVSDFVEFIK